MSKYCTYLVYEVGCFNVPAFGDLIFSDMRLLGQYGISNFLPALALVGSAAEHALPGDDAHCKVVGCDSMIIFTHYFWGHVARCSTCLI